MSRAFAVGFVVAALAAPATSRAQGTVEILFMGKVVAPATGIEIVAGEDLVGRARGGRGPFQVEAPPPAVVVSSQRWTGADGKSEGVDFRFAGQAPGNTRITIRDSKGSTATIPVRIVAPRLQAEKTVLQPGECTRIHIPSGIDPNYTLEVKGGGVGPQRSSGAPEWRICPTQAGEVTLVLLASGRRQVATLSVKVAGVAAVEPARPALAASLSGTATAVGQAPGLLLTVKGGREPISVDSPGGLVRLQPTFAPEGSRMWIVIGQAPGDATIQVRDAAGATSTHLVKVAPAPGSPRFGPEKQVFAVFNPEGQIPGATSPRFTVSRPTRIVRITTTHYNRGNGQAPGTIGLRAVSGTHPGTWNARGAAAGAVKNAFWEVTPDVVIQPGTYLVADSDPGTWSQNAKTGGLGFVNVVGREQEP